MNTPLKKGIKIESKRKPKLPEPSHAPNDQNHLHELVHPRNAPGDKRQEAKINSIHKFVTKYNQLSCHIVFVWSILQQE